MGIDNQMRDHKTLTKITYSLEMDGEDGMG